MDIGHIVEVLVRLLLGVFEELVEIPVVRGPVSERVDHPFLDFAITVERVLHVGEEFARVVIVDFVDELLEVVLDRTHLLAVVEQHLLVELEMVGYQMEIILSVLLEVHELLGLCLKGLYI